MRSAVFVAFKNVWATSAKVIFSFFWCCHQCVGIVYWFQAESHHLVEPWLNRKQHGGFCCDTAQGANLWSLLFLLLLPKKKKKTDKKTNTKKKQWNNFFSSPQRSRKVKLRSQGRRKLISVPIMSIFFCAADQKMFRKILRKDA